MSEQKQEQQLKQQLKQQRCCSTCVYRLRGQWKLENYCTMKGTVIKFDDICDNYKWDEVNYD